MQKTNSKNKLLPPTLDVVFQNLFGEAGSEQITLDFLEAILNIKIDSIDLSSNPILRREHIDDKLGVLDVIAKINGNEYCNIEMQCCTQKNMIERMLFYWSKIYSKQIKKGYNYSNLNKTIGILITNFSIEGLEDLEYKSSWKIIEEKYRMTILTDKLEFHIIELPKIVNLKNSDNKLLDWLCFLENPKSERVISKMEENKALKEANEKLEQMSNDEQMQRLAWWREKAILEENTERDAAYTEGINQRYRNW